MKEYDKKRLRRTTAQCFFGDYAENGGKVEARFFGSRKRFGAHGNDARIPDRNAQSFERLAVVIGNGNQGEFVQKKNLFANHDFVRCTHNQSSTTTRILKPFLKKRVLMRLNSAWMKKAVFFVAFVLFAILAQQIRFSSLVGAPNQFFTLFHFFAPVAGFFLGPLLGAIAIVVSQTGAFLTGTPVEFLTVFRLLPAVFSAYYFGSFDRLQEWNWKKKILSPLVWIPLLAMGVFLLDPIARGGWMFSLYWWIPVLAVFFWNRSAIARAFGATFAGHAIGSAIWAHSVPMTSSAWIQLIPTVAMERTFFAIGIFLTFEIVGFFLSHLRVEWRSGAVRIRHHPKWLWV